jgi:hypothetical protein
LLRAGTTDVAQSTSVSRYPLPADVTNGFIAMALAMSAGGAALEGASRSGHSRTQQTFFTQQQHSSDELGFRQLERHTVGNFD